MATLFEQLDLMLTLKPNWDGYDADPVEPRLVALARDFVQFFQAVEKVHGVDQHLAVRPTRVGGVQIEWQDAKYEHELEIHPDGSIGMLHIDRDTQAMVEELFQPPVEPSAVAPGLLSRLTELSQIAAAA